MIDYTPSIFNYWLYSDFWIQSVEQKNQKLETKGREIRKTKTQKNENLVLSKK